MKKISAILAFGILAAALFTGCQATPEKPVVIQKDLEQMIDSAKESDEESVILKALDVPQTYQKELTNAKGNVAVHVDANILIPNTDKIPTATVGKQVFSQETADKLMSLLLQGQTLYDMEGYMQFTKTDVEEKLVELYAMREGSIPISVDGEDSRSKETLEETIKIWESQLEKAPDETVRTPAQTTFHHSDLSDHGSGESLKPYDHIEGVAEIGGSTAHFLVQNYTDENRIYAEFCKNIYDARRYDSLDIFIGKLEIDPQKLEPKITAQAAREQADALIEKLGLDYMTCACTELGISLEGSEILSKGSEPEYADLSAVYIVRYVRVVNGVPITYTGDIGTNVEDEEAYAQPWEYEAISVVIDDTGIIEFRWTSPYTDPQIVTSDTNLLPFADIQSVFEKMLMVKYSYYEEGTLQLDVNNVQLGLMRVTNSGRRDSGLLIPVWDFFGSITAVPKNGEPYEFSKSGKSLITINAIDGSIIDRGLGY